ncbi:MAG: hypothetical protein Q7V58_10000 [Actinomycetota bacterium]|nr:hypothetical protein [Actinomycetota bacterium]
MAARAFSIYEHRARTHHFDLRLMRGDSVALWAVASAMPGPGDVAQLAIRIDELPFTALGTLDAQSDRTRWDHGPMTVRSWREGEAAVVTLHGASGGGLGGMRTVSLLHVGSVGEDDDHWTIVALDTSS